MTRINTIDPKVLLDEHLIADWREMPRIVNELRKHPERLNVSDIPEQYTLNKGHVKFFRNKLIYLKKRHEALCEEMDSRGIKRNKDIVIDFTGLCEQIAEQAMNDWVPTQRDHDINIERIRERFTLRKRAYHYFGNAVDSELDWEAYEALVMAITTMKITIISTPVSLNCRCDYKAAFDIDFINVDYSLKSLCQKVKSSSALKKDINQDDNFRTIAAWIILLDSGIESVQYQKTCDEFLGYEDPTNLISVVEMIAYMEVNGFDAAMEKYGHVFFLLFIEIAT